MFTATLPHTQTERLVGARGPFASVYFDDSHDTPGAEAQLEVKWHDIRRELRDQHATAALIAVVQRAVTGVLPHAGRTGRAVIATADGVLVERQLSVAPTSQSVRVSELPYLIPLVEFSPATEPYIVAAVDHTGADLTVHRGHSVDTETLDPGGYPVHKSAAADIHGWGDSQHRVDEMIRKNVRAVADRLTDLCEREQTPLVFIVGQDRVRAELLAALSEQVRARAVQLGVGSRPTGLDDPVRHAIAEELQNRHRDANEAVAERFRTEMGRGSGLAVTGITAVCAALREGAVETLIVADPTNDTVLAGDDPSIIARDADTLSGFGVAPTRTLRADEAIPFAAIAGGAQLVCGETNVPMSDGFGALLRYTPPDC